MERKFKPGDLVQVKSGSVQMVVIGYEINHTGAIMNAFSGGNNWQPSVETGEVLCEWFTTGTKATGMRKLFSENSLELLSDKLMKQSEEEFLQDFNFKKDDDLSKAYNTSQQLIIYEALELAITQLKELPQSKEVEEIIKDTEELRDNVQRLSKGQVVSKFVKIVAKSKKFGMNIFKAIYEVAYKEVIKAGLHEMVNEIPKLISHI
ncbi:MAG: hypothetical protein QM737_12720 [Ferruginibacter sp.]